MADLLEGDLILRPLHPISPGTYELVDAVTLTSRYGPFANLGDAAFTARNIALVKKITIWQEHVDDHGTPTGAPTILYDFRP